jgi:putative effector of murein hydrolase
VTSRGISTARAFRVSVEMGTPAELAMGLNGILNALLAPWLLGHFL